MQPLATTRRMMTWLSMCPSYVSSKARQKKVHVAHTLFVLFFIMTSLVTSLVYCFNNARTDFDGSTYAFTSVVLAIGLTYFMVSAILMRRQIDNVFASLSTIYKGHENEEEFRYLDGANNTSEQLAIIYVKYIAGSVSGVATTPVLSVLYCYWTHGNFDVDRFYRPAKFSFPWDQTSVTGYFGEIIATIPCSYTYLLLNGVPLLLFISLCIHHRAFCKMFKHKIDKSKECDTKLLCNLMRFHISAKDLFLDSANVYSSFVLVQLICNTVMMVISVFYFDLQSHHFDFSVFSAMVTASMATSTLLLYCYFGKLATESYEMMADCVYNDMKWYECEQPAELRKYFIFMMIANMQKPVYYHGFDVATLDLTTFIKLCKSVLTYYMMIKTLSAM